MFPLKISFHAKDFETMVVCLLREGGKLFIELDSNSGTLLAEDQNST